MGTHGRNAITINGIHTCHEQTIDGHFAADDMIKEIINEGKEPTIKYPTMKNKSKECNQSFFAHIDYDKKIIYISYLDPEVLLKLSNDELEYDFGMNKKDIKKQRKWLESNIKNINKVKKLKWKFVFDEYKCPSEYNCINSK